MENYFDRHQKKMEMGPHEENQKYLNVCYNSVDELKVVEIHLDHDSSYLLKTLYIHYHYNKMQRLTANSPPRRIATFKLLKRCHLGFGDLKTFLQRFSKKKIFQKKNKKTYIFPTPGPAQRMPLGVFGVKKVTILGGEFAVNRH